MGMAAVVKMKDISKKEKELYKKCKQYTENDDEEESKEEQQGCMIDGKWRTMSSLKNKEIYKLLRDERFKMNKKEIKSNHAITTIRSLIALDEGSRFLVANSTGHDRQQRSENTFL